MNRAIRILALGSVLAGVSPASAAAEWQFAPSVGFTFKGGSNLFDPHILAPDAPLGGSAPLGVNARHWSLGGTVRLVGGGPLGLEGLILYVPGVFEPAETSSLGTPITSSYGFAVMGNIVLTTPRTWNEYGLRPYVSGGLGVLRAVHNDDTLPVRANVPGYNVGGGAVGFLTNRVGVRFDLRYFRHVPPGPETTDDMPVIPGDRVRLHYWTGTVGVVLKY